MYMLTIYTYDECLVYRCKTFNECVRTISAVSYFYTIIGLDIHKVPKTDMQIRKVNKND